jgi:hypothetical protein
MKTENKFTKGNWRVETKPKKLYPFISNGLIKIADLNTTSGMEDSERKANAELIAQAPSLLRNLSVNTLFLEQIVTGAWSPEEMKNKAEALFYSNNFLIAKCGNY